MIKQNSVSGFTLAEVLITLGIIGVVAALTIPTLVANHRKKTVEVSLAKFYTTMNQAIKLAENDYGEMTYWAPDYTAWIFFCPKFNKCVDDSNGWEKYNGINAFLFAICPNGKFVSSGYCSGIPSSREGLINGCANSDPHSRHACTMLIQYDGWKISKDYPQRI